MAPEGFYDATPGAFGVLKWHINRENDAAADALPVSTIPRLKRPDALPLVLQELETTRPLGVADMAADRSAVQAATGARVAPGARFLNCEVVSRWRGRRLSEIKRADVLDMLDEIVDRGSPIAANRYFADVRNLCNWAVGRGLIDVSPCVGIRPPSAVKSRDRVLSDDELRAVWQACEGLDYPFGPLVEIPGFYWQRRDEVAEMCWQEIDLATRTWTLPRERSKIVKRMSCHCRVRPSQSLRVCRGFPGPNRFLLRPGGPLCPDFPKRRKLSTGPCQRTRRLGSIMTFGGRLRRGCARLGISLPVIEKS